MMTASGASYASWLEIDDAKTGVWMQVTDRRHIAEYLAETPLARGLTWVQHWRLENGDAITRRLPLPLPGAEPLATLPTAARSSSENDPESD